MNPDITSLGNNPFFLTTILLSTLLLVVGLAMTIHMAVRLRNNIHKFKMKPQNKPDRIEDLPSVTVCVPVRNEVKSLTACLEAVLASDYPKLEVLVVDDNSLDNTSILIKSFAHAGVRFIEGTIPPEGALGRNHAIAELAQAANGSLVFFIDADTHLSVSTISQAVHYMSTEEVDMISIIPRREASLSMSTVLESMRYFWEVVFHTKRRPGASSNAWLIRRDILLSRLNDSASLKEELRLEAAIARPLTLQNRYRLLLSDRRLGVVHERRMASIAKVGIRTLFPYFSDLSRFGAIWAFFYIGVLALLPWSVIALVALSATSVSAEYLVAGLETTSWLAILIFIVALSAATMYGIFLRNIWGSRSLASVVLWPVVIVQEFILYVASVIGYKTKSVKWKGRPVILPRRQDA